MLRHRAGIYALAVLLAAAAGCSEQEPDGSAKTGPPETVTILGATSDHKKYMQRHFDQWAKTSGIHVTYVTSSDFENEAPERLRSADPPDLLLLPSPHCCRSSPRRATSRIWRRWASSTATSSAAGCARDSSTTG
ncbi:ABC-type glycerol-3-phosphate transport system substrate-binding protein [Micromonospora vinacea]|uniref:ABC-type glycerol-3-phosphate transport system substrate-binding protein n=1 Tax=Micromonospora vinacea TaxID=709878 RepID=A0ABS0KBC4_9ACTN|nr:hypothetical protein [Micromonospora vinacea]MBG6105932.1 ABC-type glycerol-3-phosphate transport system substrate-binding protein [Micromonospora vinacea]